MAAAYLLLAGVLLPCWAAFPQVKRWGTKPADQGSHQHNMPLPKGFEVRIQGRDVSPPVPFDLEEDTCWSLPFSFLPWGQRPWEPPSCSKSSS
nr:PREDICTED: LOW QUALITY PROTEIN: colipase-like protein 2 [Rhinolophus sinicus]